MSVKDFISAARLKVERAVKIGNNRAITPAELMEVELEDLRSGERKANAVVMIFIGDEDGNFNVNYAIANANTTTTIAAVEIMKVHMLKRMGYLKDEG